MYLPYIGGGDSQHYDTVMPTLANVLMRAQGNENRLLRGKAIECITLVGASLSAPFQRPPRLSVRSLPAVRRCSVLLGPGMAVGSERFREDAIKVMQVLVQTNRTLKRAVWGSAQTRATRSDLVSKIRPVTFGSCVPRGRRPAALLRAARVRACGRDAQGALRAVPAARHARRAPVGQPAAGRCRCRRYVADVCEATGHGGRSSHVVLSILTYTDDDDLEKYDANEGWQVLQLEDKVPPPPPPTQPPTQPRPPTPPPTLPAARRPPPASAPAAKSKRGQRREGGSVSACASTPARWTTR